MRRAFSDAMMTAGSVLVLILLLVMLDDRVHEQISMRLSSQPTAQIARAGSEVRNLAAVVAEAAQRQTMEHAPLVIFGLAGTVLVVFMLRT